jgi:hypothetical protein
MTSKERVNRTYSHKEADRIPIDYLANPGIDLRMKKHFQLAENDDEALLRKLSVDFRNVEPPYIGPSLHPKIENRKIDMWGIRRTWVENKSGGYWDYCDFPLQNATVEEIEAWPMPNPDDFDYDIIIEQICKSPDSYITIGHPGTGDLINTTSMLRNMEVVLMDLASEEPETTLLIERRINIQLEVLKRSLHKANGAIDLLWIGEDLGTQIGPMISVDMFRSHIRPHLQKFVDLAQSFNIPVMMHSCGSSSWSFNDLIDMGITVLDTLQPEAANMEPAYLKKTFGDRLSFHGCISTAGAVAYSGVEETVADIEQILDIMMPGGGYAFSPTHMLQDNSPTENVLAMYETALNKGTYH